MLLFKALHILSMFAAVTFLVGEALLYGRAIWRRDVAGLAAARRMLGPRPLIGVAFLVAGIVFGALAAVTGAIDLLEGWLIAAYVAVLALFAVNASPWVQRLPRLGEAALQASPEGPSADEIHRAIEAARPSTVVVVIVNVVLFAAIILDMVLKPF
jgi:Mn2+/Fe2+ NRAMP family transporter